MIDRNSCHNQLIPFFMHEHTAVLHWFSRTCYNDRSTFSNHSDAGLRNKMQLVEIYRIMKKDQQLRKKQKTQFPMMQLGLRSHFRALKKPN